MSEDNNENKFLFMKRQMKMFEYDTMFYVTWALLGLCIWLAFTILGKLHYTDVLIAVERIFWWAWFLLTAFIFHTRTSRLVYKHNMQVIDANFRELFDAKINAALLKELIPIRKAQEKKKKAAKNETFK